jgi:hypothetical protein
MKHVVPLDWVSVRRRGLEPGCLTDANCLRVQAISQSAFYALYVNFAVFVYENVKGYHALDAVCERVGRIFRVRFGDENRSDECWVRVVLPLPFKARGGVRDFGCFHLNWLGSTGRRMPSKGSKQQHHEGETDQDEQFLQFQPRDTDDLFTTNEGGEEPRISGNARALYMPTVTPLLIEGAPRRSFGISCKVRFQ